MNIKHNCSPPSDITFIHEGNKTFHDNLVNFEKLVRLRVFIAARASAHNSEADILKTPCVCILFPAHDSRHGASHPTVSEKSHGSVFRLFILPPCDDSAFLDVTTASSSSSVFRRSTTLCSLSTVTHFLFVPGNGITEKSSSEVRAYIDHLHIIDNQQTLFELSHRLEPRA